MIKKLYSIFLILGVACSISLSCSENIPDCPSQMCVMSGGWVLTEAYVDDVKETIDLTKYSLVLNQPAPTTAITSVFDRTQVSGSHDNGTWSIENEDTVLKLQPDNNQIPAEEWIIESFTPRQLVMVIIRDDIKQGPAEIRFVLEPF